MNAVYRAGLYTCPAAVTALFIQLNPVVPGQGVMRTGRDAFVVWTGQTYFNCRYLRPFSVHQNSGTFGGILSKMGPRTDDHANLTLGA